MTDLPIVSLLRRGHAQPCECVECEAAALISDLVAAGNQASIALNYATGDLDNPMIAMAAKAHANVAIVELDAALSRAKGEK